LLVGEPGAVETESQSTAFRRGNQIPEHLRCTEEYGWDSCNPTLRAMKLHEGWGTLDGRRMKTKKMGSPPASAQ
jgi:hypothetical protein